MANVASMGPPPSPKEPRRSGRRSGPSTSTSKSPAGSPTAETAPKSKENPQRPPIPSSSSSARTKRTKNEETDDPVDENHKNGVNGTTNGRSRRKADTALGDGNAQEEEEEEQGVTRCICQETGVDESEAGEFMAECEICHAWQHGTCMGYQSPETMPLHYYCERCRPDLYTELLKKHAKRARQSSASHHSVTNPTRTSRSHSPTYLLKQPAKRRNTMNSRDAAYDESLQAVIEASAAEAAANAAAAQEATSPATAMKTEQATNGHLDPEPEPEPISSGRRKRKRSDDDTSSSKRTRSASIVSDLPTHGNNAAAETSPVTTTKAALPPMSTAKAGGSRAKRGGGRKTLAQQQQDHMSVEGDNNEAVAGTSSAPRRQGNSRSKANAAAHDHGTRRNQPNGSSGHAAALHGNSSRAYHNSHAYAVSQQPLLTSWGLPDYLSHLEQMLPTQTPRPLEVRGFGTITNGQDISDRTTERGVKVKWPSKRMSVGDMNKRVRALVEWVGREQASAAERTRRREAIEKSLREARAPSADPHSHREGEGDEREGDANSPMVLDRGAVTDSPTEELRQPPLDGLSAPLTLDGPGPNPGKSTMKMMEELMEELISFQERFGPGAKMKERERRTATS